MSYYVFNKVKGWKKNDGGYTLRFSEAGWFDTVPEHSSDKYAEEKVLDQELMEAILLAGVLQAIEEKENKYDPLYGDGRMCVCGHSYYRHFDTYEDMRSVGCKYCECGTFIEVTKK